MSYKGWEICKAAALASTLPNQEVAVYGSFVSPKSIRGHFHVLDVPRYLVSNVRGPFDSCYQFYSHEGERSAMALRLSALM